jgi:hypothetical protein
MFNEILSVSSPVKGIILSALAKYVINRLIHGLCHIALVISPRTNLASVIIPSTMNVIYVFQNVERISSNVISKFPNSIYGETPTGNFSDVF